MIDLAKCSFCNEERHRIREAFDEGTAKIISAGERYALSVDTSRDDAVFNIFYCPMCGRELKRTHARGDETGGAE